MTGVLRADAVRRGLLDAKAHQVSKAFPDPQGVLVRLASQASMANPEMSRAATRNLTSLMEVGKRAKGQGSVEHEG